MSIIVYHVHMNQHTFFQQLFQQTLWFRSGHFCFGIRNMGVLTGMQTQTTKNSKSDLYN
ncbi:hypothetical protein HanRHA438_Chr17g0831031 [Helianthus annuus]|nr:hypothetical protein HanRHA438_Chr17g0831031 [Helianthus annuus]